LCAEVVDQINIHKHPAFADFGSGHFSTPRFLAQRDGMKVQQLSGGVQVERLHGYQEQAQPAIFLGSSQT
jgi:hypothetical protein